MKSSKMKSDTPYDLLNFTPDTLEAQDLFSKRCTTAEEKYRILEARDKLIRARIPKVKVRVELATKLFGTCPDMCPEKERYMRQYQRQLTSFEILQTSQEIVVDNRRAIKVYSRSSADQEEPLPHELRPGPTLELTMNYLLHNIVRMAEESDEILGDWYNFLWDRTRSIRKDITQQQLTDLQVVSLMEKCARFHIHCSSRLCELDLHTFDPKLNDENLMKCLQSLEHLYDDLRRRNTNCPNEPEFRAYQIMMNLNEGDILWDVQQRPDWILKSSEVQAALKIHHCVFNRNFVSFFRLVKSLPYMFSCILHRYFFQVRCTALRALWKSHSFRKTTKEVQMSFSGVQRMLGYGDAQQEFRTLCESHGIQCEEENDHLLIDRKKFFIPDNRIVSREKNLIESKLTTSIAEAINGCPLAPNPIMTYVPHSSFDEDGFLIPGSVVGAYLSEAALSASKQHQDNVAKTIRQSQMEMQEKLPNDTTDSFANSALQKSALPGFLSKQSSSQAAPRINVFTGQPIFGGTSFSSRTQRGRSSSSAQKVPTPPPQPTPEEIRMKKLISIDSVCNAASDKLMGVVFQRELQQAISDAIYRADMQKRMQERLWQKQQIRTHLSELAINEFVHNAVPRLVFQIATEEIRRHHFIRMMCEAYVEKFIIDNIQKKIPSICNKVIRQKLQEKLMLENKLRTIFTRLKLRLMLHKWLNNAQEKRHKRRLYEEKLIQDMLDFPASNPYGRSSEEMLFHLKGNGKSPNIVKTTLSTGAWLDKYEKADAAMHSYTAKIQKFVFEAHQRSLTPTHPLNLPENPSRLKSHGDFYRHCWKRKWSSLGNNENDDSKQSSRTVKSPRQDFNASHLGFKNGMDHAKAKEKENEPRKSSADALLEEIRKFTDDARKEKENFKLLDDALQKTVISDCDF